MSFDWEFAWQIMPDLIDGLGVTIQATLLGIVLAMILGLGLAILRRSSIRAISWPTAWVVMPVATSLRQSPLSAWRRWTHSTRPRMMPALQFWPECWKPTIY